MAATYYAQILARWDWPELVRMTKADAYNHRHLDGTLCADGCDESGHIGSAYLGSVMNNAPSSKFYMPWTTNQTADDVDRDSRWYAALDKAAEKFGGWIENGEGDPTDLYFSRYCATPPQQQD